MTAPRPVRPTRSLRTGGDLPRWFWARLTDEELPEEASDFENAMYLLVSEKRLRAAWERRRDEILEAWIARWPGSRPTCWWRFDAPRVPRAFIERWPVWGPWVLDECHVPRERVSGIGRCVEHGPRAEAGFPTWWEDLDPAAPPTFESEASYLRRYGLLVPGEKRRLRTADFAPEVLPRDLWPDLYKGDDE